MPKYRKKNTRKMPCEICGANCNVSHRVDCKWAYLPRPTNKAIVKRMSIIEKIKTIIQIIKL